MDRKSIIETEILLRNNSPIPEFENLSANDFHSLIYETYSENSPVHFNKIITDETLDQVPLFRLAEDYIQLIHREKFIKLTPLGALQKKVLVELYAKGYVKEDFIERGISKLSREQDFIGLMSARLTLEIAGIVKKTKGKITLTKKGISFLERENRQQFFELLFATFADKFSIGYHDLYPEVPVGQLGWAFSVYLLNSYDKGFEPERMYAEKYLDAFPHFLLAFSDEDYADSFDQFCSCYTVRTFPRFLVWFGIVVEQDSRLILFEDNHVKATALLSKIFYVDAG